MKNSITTSPDVLDSFNYTRENFLHHFAESFFGITVSTPFLTDWSENSRNQMANDPAYGVGKLVELIQKFDRYKENSSKRDIKKLLTSFLPTLDKDDLREMYVIMEILEHNEEFSKKASAPLFSLHQYFKASAALPEGAVFGQGTKEIRALYASLGVLPRQGLRRSSVIDERQTTSGNSYIPKKNVNEGLMKARDPLGILQQTARKSGWTARRWNSVPLERHQNIALMDMNLDTLARVLYDRGFLGRALKPATSYSDFQEFGNFLLKETDDVIQAKEAYKQKYDTFRDQVLMTETMLMQGPSLEDGDDVTDSL